MHSMRKDDCNNDLVIISLKERHTRYLYTTKTFGTEAVFKVIDDRVFCCGENESSNSQSYLA